MHPRTQSDCLARLNVDMVGSLLGRAPGLWARPYTVSILLKDLDKGIEGLLIKLAGEAGSGLIQRIQQELDDQSKKHSQLRGPDCPGLDPWAEPNKVKFNREKNVKSCQIHK